jgi:hypothetical protein
MVGQAACRPTGEKRNESRVVVGKPDRKSPLEIPRLRWKDNITMNLEEIEWYRYELD